MKKVVSIVLNSFENDSRVLKEAVSLYRNGYEVNVVALHQPPLNVRDLVHDIPVHRIKLRSRSWPKLKPVQLVKYIEFVYRVIKEYKNADIFHCNDLHTLPVGALVKRFVNSRAKVVYDAHEFEINDRPNQSKTSIRFKYFLEKLLIRYADKTITVSNSIADEYVKLYGIEKPALVLNAPPYRVLKKTNIFRETFDLSEKQTVFLYQGGLSYGRGIEILIETFSRADNDNVLVFMGYGPLQDTVQNACSLHTNMFYHKAVAPDILLNFTASADFGMLFYENNCLNHFYCSPNKIFEYLMAGIPVIVSKLYEMKSIVERNHLGVVADENTALGLERAINSALRLDRTALENNISKVKSLYNWETQEKTLLQTYRDLESCAVSAE